MQHRLSGTFAAVVYHAVAVIKSLLICDFGDNLKNMRNYCAVFGGYVIPPLDVFLGNYKNVYGCLWGEILKSSHGVILVYLR